MPVSYGREALVSERSAAVFFARCNGSGHQSDFICFKIPLFANVEKRHMDMGDKVGMGTVRQFESNVDICTLPCVK